MGKRKSRFNTGIPGLSFSWKRALGISRFKYNIAKITGIPTTSSGRQRKLGRLMGCAVPYIFIIHLFVFIVWAVI